MAAPTPRRVLIRADGGSRGNPGPAAYGAVLEDADTGTVLAETAEAIGQATNNVAEYRGLIAGLELARQYAPGAAVEVRLDSKLIIEQMAGRWKVKHPDMRPLALRARALVPSDTRWTWVPREDNSHADRLLNAALDAATGRSRRSVPPAFDRQVAPAAAVSDGAETGLAETDPPAARQLSRLAGWRTDPGSPTTLLLLRHGETAHTAARLFSGSGGDDPALTDEGRAQAMAAAAWLAARGDIDALVSSPLRRTRETAAAVADALALQLGVDSGMAEADFGSWDAKSFTEVQERWPSELEAWLGSTDVAPPGGESFAQVSRRVRSSRDRLLRDHAGKTVVVVTHVTPIKLLVRGVLDAPLQSIYRMELPPASLTELRWYADGTPSLRQFAVRP
ncbi:MAG TPA: bifunctional RNase H/acid phosphatase [Nocardioidaceae bacterium]|nr:bifunctional RNase H/acid phosphatase [Nocardioidaceae bacterium]